METVTAVVPNNVQAMITGATMARIHASGLCRLTYQDGSEESATLTKDELTESRGDWFRLVGIVQSKRA